MQIIAHRINTIEELKKIPREYGLEIDLRDRGNDLILQHDPFSDGELFEDWLKEYKHGTIILNIKSERIEYRVKELLHKYQVTDYFFLDSSFPMINLLSKEGDTNIALRFSEYEGMDTILNFQNKAKWVWIDCFTKLPIDKQKVELFKKSGFKTCLVSPELQGRPEDIPVYREFIQKNKIKLDAVCTKGYNAETWEK